MEPIRLSTLSAGRAREACMAAGGRVSVSLGKSAFVLVLIADWRGDFLLICPRGAEFAGTWSAVRSFASACEAARKAEAEAEAEAAAPVRLATPSAGRFARLATLCETLRAALADYAKAKAAHLAAPTMSTAHRLAFWSRSVRFWRDRVKAVHLAQFGEVKA